MHTTNTSGFDALWPQLTCFPLRAMRDGRCTCEKKGCDKAGKHPACNWGSVPRGHKCTGYDGCAACFSSPVEMDGGIGIATGERSGIFVVETDSAEAETWLVGRGVPRTLLVRSGSDRGNHRYFAHPGFYVRCSNSELAPKVDVKGDGGLVVAPDSPHKSGGLYRIIDDAPVAPAPDWLLSWSGLRAKERLAKTQGGAVPVVPSGSIEETERVREAIAYLETAEPAISGEGGHNRLFIVAQKLVRWFELSDAVSYALIVRHYNARCLPWSAGEIHHKISEARHRGRFETRREVEAFTRAILGRLA
jgi:hypothetical protein